MEIKQIIQNLKKGITTLLDNESNNLKRRLNELNISNHLAFYLKPLFSEYNVDPEYNGDIEKPNDRKALDIAKKRILEIRRTPNSTNNYKFSPDIIVHRRETNDHNLLVIEVKKDINPSSDKEFDLIKLEHLTINYLGNHYNYKLGVAIIFGTGENTGQYEIRYFQNGIEFRPQQN
ncbi:hypothetical protein CMU93_04260 [Elizabethkingia anophelis]|nr:hypothetical protein [Elizabethkingia anophelis]